MMMMTVVLARIICRKGIAMERKEDKKIGLLITSSTQHFSFLNIIDRHNKNKCQSIETFHFYFSRAFFFREFHSCSDKRKIEFLYYSSASHWEEEEEETTKQDEASEKEKKI